MTEDSTTRRPYAGASSEVDMFKSFRPSRSPKHLWPALVIIAGIGALGMLLLRLH